jgi:hypothetical protein
MTAVGLCLYRYTSRPIFPLPPDTNPCLAIDLRPRQAPDCTVRPTGGDLTVGSPLHRKRRDWYS